MIATIPIAASDPTFAAALVASALPTDDVGDPGRSFFRVEQDGRLLGYGGFELYGQDALLRSIVVPAKNRGKGYGRAVADGVMREIANAGGRRAYLLTTSAAAFFEHLGFIKMDRAKAPASILATRQASSICSSAALLSRTI